MRAVIPRGINRNLVHLTGAIVTWWGRIEGCLITDLITLRQQPECADLARKERFPVQTGRIIKQWCAARRLVFANAPHKLAQVEKLETALIKCSTERNIIVHSFWPYGAERDSDSIRIQSIKTKRGTHDVLEFSVRSIDVKSLDELNDKLCRLYHSVMVCGVQLFVGPDKVSQSTILPRDPQSVSDAQ